MSVKKYKVQPLSASGVPTLIDLKTGLPEIWSRIRQLFYDKDEVTAELSLKQDTLTAGDNISISNDNKISTSGVYTSTETDKAISEAIDGLKSEVESELSNIQSSLDSVASDIPSVVEGDNISVTHTGTVYTVSAPNVYTQADVDAALAKKQDLLTAGTGISIVDNVVTCTLDTTIYTVVTELPADGDENRIYLLYVPDASTEGSRFDEYIWINSTWVKIGEHTTEVDLSDYYTKSETDTAINKVTESLTDYLPLKGGTMSGDIVIGSSGTTIRCSDGHIVLSSGIELY